MTASVVDLSDVVVRFDGRTVLGPVTLRIMPGERWVTLGPNGSGKTTLLSIVGARRQPSSGTARVLELKFGRGDVRTLHDEMVGWLWSQGVRKLWLTTEAGTRAEHFYLLDLEGIRRHRNLNRRRRIKNLVQLNRTLGRYLRPADKIRFLNYYLGRSFSSPADKRVWVARVLRQSKRLDRLRDLKMSAVAIGGQAAHES